ncbi:unnamed protein product [Paramecium octaurelia]|uniref:WD domain, G-beta repeat protein n=1 Tax=Paramecium octaurelia TaxID=43137 RepID=A0A8S1YFN1_PAROT|nr:unnamed protein product [Paramecium octaurelia]
MEERLICETCLKQKQLTSQQFISYSSGIDQAKDYSKQIKRNLEPYLNEIEGKFQLIQKDIDQQKSHLNHLLEYILKDINQWHQAQIQTINLHNNAEDFLKMIENIKRNDEDWLQDYELKITYQIQQLAYNYYHKIDKHIKQYTDQSMNFKIADKVIDVARISQEMCWNAYTLTSKFKKKQLEEKFQLIECLEHKRKANKINIEKNVPKNQRILCKECLQNGISIIEFIKTWDKIQLEKINEQQNAQKYMQECYTKSLFQLEQLRNAQYKNLTNMIDSVYLKIVDGSKCFQQIYLQSHDFSINKYQEMAEMCCKEQEKCELQTSQFRLHLYQQGKTMVQDVKQILIYSWYSNGPELQLTKNRIKEEEINNKQSQLEQNYRLPNKFKIQPMLTYQEVNKQEIYAIVFNRNGSLLLTGGNDQIQVFIFEEGELTAIRKMHCQRSVSVLQFFQQTNDFISGHSDGSLCIWNYCNQIYYKEKIYENIHSESVRFLIINEKQNELISIADDSIIQVNFLGCDIKLKQSLVKHEKTVISISLNPSETILLSCSEDGQLIIWKKNEYDEWVFNNFIHHSVRQYGNKIVFIKDDQFIWTQFSESKIIIFEEANQTFIQKSQKSIINERKSNVKFPFIYSTQFNLIICNHGQTIELAQLKSDGLFQIVSRCEHKPKGQQRGAVTNDSKYLVIWNQKQFEFTIFKLYS